MALPGWRVLQLVTGGWQPGSARVSCMQFLAISDLFWRAEIFSMIRFHVRFVFKNKFPAFHISIHLKLMNLTF